MQASWAARATPPRERTGTRSFRLSIGVLEAFQHGVEDGANLRLVAAHQHRVLQGVLGKTADFLKVLNPEQTVTIDIENAEAAAVFNADDGAYGYVVMPLSRDR